MQLATDSLRPTEYYMSGVLGVMIAFGAFGPAGFLLWPSCHLLRGCARASRRQGKDANFDRHRGYWARRAKSGLGQFLQISFARAAALVFGPSFQRPMRWRA